MSKFHLIPYKKSKSSVSKYHILNLDDTIIKSSINNVYAFFGREFSKNSKQHRLNICFSKDDIQSNNKIYLELSKIILEMENYFKLFDDFVDYELVSNIIERDQYGKVIRFHLKTQNDQTTTPFTLNDKIASWIEFDKTKTLNFTFHPDCLWVDAENKKYGVSYVIDHVYQKIRN